MQTSSDIAQNMFDITKEKLKEWQDFRTHTKTVFPDWMAERLKKKCLTVK